MTRSPSPVFTSLLSRVCPSLYQSHFQLRFLNMGDQVCTHYSRQGLTSALYNGSNTSLFVQQMPLQTHPISHLSFSWLSSTGTLSLPRTPSSFSSSVISRWWAPVKLGKAEGSAAQRTAPTASLYLRLLRGRRRHKWVCNSCHSSCYSQQNPVNVSHSHSLSNPWDQDQVTNRSIFGAQNTSFKKVLSGGGKSEKISWESHTTCKKP